MVNVEVVTTLTNRACQKAIAMVGNGLMTSAGRAGVGYGNVGHGYEAACNSLPQNVRRAVCGSCRYILREKRLKQSIANWHRGICSAITIQTTSRWRLPRWMVRLLRVQAPGTGIGILSTTLRREHYAQL